MDTSTKMNETITTPIGTLEWNVKYGPVLPANLESMRPTTDEDTKGKLLVARQYAFNELITEPDYMRNALIYVATSAIKVVRDDYMREGPILLCFTNLQLHWDIMLQCNVYKVEP
jgi:hypothetical protein